jgi:hypothetical protein
MDIIAYAFLAASVAYSHWIWSGSPNSDTGEYHTEMIFSFWGRFLLVQYHKAERLKPLFKLFLCPYCLSVWVAFGLGGYFIKDVFQALLVAVGTAPFITLFMYLNSKSNGNS